MFFAISNSMNQPSFQLNRVIFRYNKNWSSLLCRKKTTDSEQKSNMHYDGQVAGLLQHLSGFTYWNIISQTTKLTQKLRLSGQQATWILQHFLIQFPFFTVYDSWLFLPFLSIKVAAFYLLKAVFTIHQPYKIFKYWLHEVPAFTIP